MPKTTWSHIFTWIAWLWPSQTLETGTPTSTDSWRERVCTNYNNDRVVYVGRGFSWCAFMYCSVALVLFGSWYDHVNNWWKKKQTYSKLHYMFYEDMIEVFQLFLWVFSNSAYFFKVLLQLVVKQWWYLIVVLAGHWTGNRQTLLLSWFVAFGRGEESNHVWSAVWQHEKERHDQLFNIPCYGFQDFSFHEKR